MNIVEKAAAVFLVMLAVGLMGFWSGRNSGKLDMAAEKIASGYCDQMAFGSP
jgi:hypothetical protein